MTTNANITNKRFHNSITDYTNSPVYTVSGSNGTSWPTGSSTSIDWANTSITTTGTGYYYNNTTTPTTIDSAGTLELRGNNADIKVNGRSLMSAIDAIEQRLNILVPNPELEKEWDELKELGERYRELEKKCKEKGEMWAKLKEIKK